VLINLSAGFCRRFVTTPYATAAKSIRSADSRWIARVASTRFCPSCSPIVVREPRSPLSRYVAGPAAPSWGIGQGDSNDQAAHWPWSPRSFWASRAFRRSPLYRLSLYAATNPRRDRASRDLADYERATIALFERVSPSVVQLSAASAEVATTRGGGAGTGPGPASSGTRPDHVVTNDHVSRAPPRSGELASGEAREGEISALHRTTTLRLSV